ncbi:MAG: protoporphyrinogen oxidase [Verrucomicrobiae bacterium]|nr:protoporphyrinogen oxidase [Verrucomicrobiae bacterium]
MDPVDFIVVGGGISGLVAATALKANGRRVLLLEAGPRLGGMAWTYFNDMYACEAGPGLLCLANPAAEEFLRNFGFLSTVNHVNRYASKRYVCQGGRAVEIPASLPGILKTGMISWGAKLALFKEYSAERSFDPDETVAAFVQRRFGAECLEQAVDPLLRSVFFGEPEKLCAQHAIPWLWRIQNESGGIVCSILKRGVRSFFERKFINWTGGFSELVSGLDTTLKPDAQVGQPVESIRRIDGGYEVRTQGGAYQSARVVVATDAGTAGRLLSPLLSTAGDLQLISRASVAVVHLCFRRAAVKHDLEGMGLFIGRSQGLRTQSVLFASSVRPGAAPAGHVLLSARVGGTRHADVLQMKNEALVKLVFQELMGPLQIHEGPVNYSVVRWPGSIPQYERDYDRVETVCETVEKECEGIHLLGNYRGGLWVDDCIGNAYLLAKRLMGAG